MQEKEFITTEEVSNILGISKKTIYKLGTEGRINPKCGQKYGKYWRFRKSLVLNNQLLKE